MGNISVLKAEYYPMALFILRKGGICLTDETRRLRNEYMREWRAKNKDKVKEAQDRYWRKKSLEEKTINKER